MDYECAITTTDNPYDPFTNFDAWLEYDTRNEYFSCNILARLVNLTDDMTERETDEAIEAAIDRIIDSDPTNLYKKVTRKAS